MKTIVLVQFIVDGLQQKLPFQIAAKNEPNKNQILEKIMEIVEHYDLSKEVQFEKFTQEKGQKIYLFKIGEKSCIVIVDRLDIIEFTK
jgi:hypothetical protein